ncbi:MAG: N-acetylmuramoyl-L-alanine amidase [Acidobacteriota bacterium]
MPVARCPPSWRRLATAVMVLLGALGGVPGADQVLEIHPAVRLAVNDAGDLFFEVKAAPGDGWSQMAARFATSADDWEAIRDLNGGGDPRRGRYYRVPYALLNDSFRFLGIAALFPEDVLGSNGWVHRVGTARLPIEEESLYRLAFWLTGDGENFRAILAANHLQDPSLQPGQEIRIPPALLSEPFREAVTPTDSALIYGQDREGDYAGYRLRKGEALYSAIVVRFTDRVDPDDVEKTVKRIAARSGIDRVTDIPSGFLVKIPLDLLAVRFLPPNDPRRVDLEMNRLLAAQYQSTVESKDLADIVVILDPGHGGIDVGTSQNGVWEDDVVYDIAIRLKQKLEVKTAARVEMTLRDRSQKDRPHNGRFTRTDRDEMVLSHPPLITTDSRSRAVGVNLRAFLANSIYRRQVRKGGDDQRIVFISIHADALHRSMRGAMIYVPGERFRRARYGATGTRYRKYREVREKPYVSFTRSQRLRSEGLSRQFASSALDAFRRHGLPIHAAQPVRDHVVRRGRSWVPAVLRGNQVPIKVLFEVANIANRHDAADLASPKHRDLIAEALLDTLLSFYRGR